MTIVQLAKQMSEAFIQDKRTNGDEFWKLKDGSPEWMTDVIHKAHGDMIPDDWRYSIIRDCVSSLADADENTSDDDMRDMITEWADSDTDVYNNHLLQWLASRLDRADYCDDAASEYGFNSENGIIGTIQQGQFREREEVYMIMITALSELAEEQAETAA